ncbi:MAG: tetratricopeptide repeat protein [Phycisphaerales bacterium]|nr:MAG: tetratricopeptide repeat protein [Phycisphaerales bacterium]
MTPSNTDKGDAATALGDRLFVGRQAELEQFDQVLASPKGQAVVVVGQAGMGKTMLVDRMKHRAESHSGFKCGAVRYEVTPTDPPGGTMALMLEDAVSAARASKKTILGTDNQWRALFKAAGLIPGAGKVAEALGDLVLSLTWDTAKPVRRQFMDRLRFISGKMPANGRAIFVVDPEKYMKDGSADDWRLVVRDLPEKIIFLFAQRPEDVLISSSDFMALDNVTRIPGQRLDPLDEGNVDELIDARKTQLPVSTIEAREAVRRYEGHPYAVQAALDLLVDGRPINELPPDPTPEGIAETQWRQVCDKHKEKAIALFEAYAILEVAVPDEVVEGVSGLDSSARKALVANAYLAGLHREEQDGKRIYHSLLLDHIRGQLSDEEGKTYHRRAVDIYRSRLTAEAKPDALGAVRLPEHVLLAEGPEAFTVSLAGECTRPLLTLGLLDAAISLSHRALNDFVSPGTKEEANIRGNLGLIYTTRGNLDKAEDMLRRTLALSDKLGLLECAAKAYGNLGIIYKTRGNLDKAEETHRKSLAIEQKLGRLEGMASDYGNLGLIYQIRGELDKAEEVYRKSLGLVEKLGHLQYMGTLYGNLGMIYYARGDLEKAEQAQLDSLRISQKLGRLEGMADAYGNLGLIYQIRGDLDQAEKLHRKSLEIEEKLDRVAGMATQYGNLGLIYSDRGHLDKAEEMYRKALDIDEKLGHLEGVARHVGNLGRIYERRGDLKAAREHWTKARDLYQRIGMPREVETVQGWVNGLKDEGGRMKDEG